MNEFLAMRVVEGAILFSEVPNNRKSSVAAILNGQGHGDLVTEDVPDDGNDDIISGESVTKEYIDKAIESIKPTKGIDYFTENDKMEFLSEIYDLIKNGGVIGFVDENNNIVLTGKLTDGNYSIKYETEDGSIDIGNLVLDNNVYCSVTSNLTNCTNGNVDAQVIKGESYSATISAKSGYELSSIVVTMGGTDITSSVVSDDGSINITNVTGNIVITAVAEEVTDDTPSETTYTNLLLNAGYKMGYRIKASTGKEEVMSGVMCSGFMPVTEDGIIRIKNITLNDTDNYNAVVAYKVNDDTYEYVAGNFLINVTPNDGIYTFSLNSFNSNFIGKGITHFRFCCAEITDDTIVTVNEEITE